MTGAAPGAKKPTAAQSRRMRTAARLYAVQALFQMEQAVSFCFRQLLYGNARPVRYDISNILLRYDEFFLILLLPFLLTAGDLTGQLLALIPQRRAFFKILTGQSRFLFLAYIGQLLFQFL